MIFRFWPIAKQIGALALVLTVIVFSVLGVITYTQASKILEDKGVGAVKDQVDRVSELLTLQYNSLVDLAENNADLFEDMFPNRLTLAGRNQLIGGVNTPLLEHNGMAVNNRAEEVDRYAQLTGGNATVFVREGDDFLRIATSLKKENGQRALGTYLGKSHPGYKKLISGEAFEGYAHLFGRDYMTVYRPVKDNQNRVIAILYIGFDITKTLSKLQESVNSLSLEESGQFLIFRKVDQKIIAHRNHSKGQVLTDSMLDGFSVNQAMEQQRSWFYNNRQNHAMYTYSIDVSGWEWKLLGLVKIDELKEESLQLLRLSLFVTIAGVLLVTGLLYWVLLRTLKPMTKLQAHIQALGEGDLTVEFYAANPESQNEVDRITLSTRAMAENLRQLILSLQQSVTSLEQQASNAKEVARLNGEEAQALLGETDQIATAIEEMSTSIRDVANHASEGASRSHDVDEASRSGQKQLISTVEGLTLLSEHLSECFDAVQSVSKESEAISQVTEVINSIAEQTNLLALNAAIEAARAGEQGRGFAVVADEVRTLAQRTQNSITEISQTISQLQAVVKTTAEKMTQSHELGIRSVEQGQEVSQQLNHISHRIGELAISASSIASAAEEQSTVATEVSKNLHHITELAGEGESRSTETLSAAQSLADLAIELKEKISIFRA